MCETSTPIQFFASGSSQPSGNFIRATRSGQINLNGNMVYVYNNTTASNITLYGCFLLRGGFGSLNFSLEEIEFSHFYAFKID